MEISVKGRDYFELIRGTDDEEALFSMVRVISVNSVRLPEEPPFSRKFWEADNVLVLRFDDVDDSDPLILQGTRFMSEADAEAIAAFVDAPDKKMPAQKSQPLTCGTVMIHSYPTNPLSLWSLAMLKFGGFLFFKEVA